MTEQRQIAAQVAQHLETAIRRAPKEEVTPVARVWFVQVSVMTRDHDKEHQSSNSLLNSPLNKPLDNLRMYPYVYGHAVEDFTVPMVLSDRERGRMRPFLAA